MSHVAVSDLRTAAYCPRKLYYARQEDDRSPPPEVAEIRALASRYPDLMDATDAALRAEPIAVDPATYRRRLRALADRRDDWAALVDPAATDALLTGRDVRGIARKVLADPPRPVLVSPGEPPDNGVWAPQSVAAVALAKALAYEREASVERAVVEYPAHAVVRTVRLTTRKKAAYRRVLRTAREMDGPPPRVDDRGKCESCEYRRECGVPTRTLASLLGG